MLFDNLSFFFVLYLWQRANLENGEYALFYSSNRWCAKLGFIVRIENSWIDRVEINFLFTFNNSSIILESFSIVNECLIL
jgi:hypothetical protein